MQLITQVHVLCQPRAYQDTLKKGQGLGARRGKACAPAVLLNAHVTSARLVMLAVPLVHRLSPIHLVTSSHSAVILCSICEVVHFQNEANMRHIAS